MTAIAEETVVKYPWQAATLKSAREALPKVVKQEELADMAGIARTVYNALERGRRKLTEANARRLAPHLHVAPEDLLPPPEDAAGPEGPYALLQGLAETVGKQQTTIDSLQDKVEALERVASKRRRASGDER